VEAEGDELWLVYCVPVRKVALVAEHYEICVGDGRKFSGWIVRPPGKAAGWQECPPYELRAGRRGWGYVVH